MRVLVLGGTAWLGSQLARAALEHGAAVTCLARGESGAPPPGATLVRADRTSPHAYDEVAAATWDLVVDVARHPGHVRTAVDALAGRVGTWVFVSSCNVYADHSRPGADETDRLLPPLDADVMPDMSVYGQAKVACEQLVQRGIGDERSLVARAGLIGGPGDPFDRSDYWPLRFAGPADPDGAVLVPDAPDLATQLIDVRDLAAWLVDAGLRGTAGVMNAAGESRPLREHLDVAREVAGHAGALVAAEEQWLLDEGVQPWMGPRSLPLWLPDPDWRGFCARDTTRARAAGLRTRPLAETLTETLAWTLARDPARPRKAGLTDDEERDLLAKLTA